MAEVDPDDDSITRYIVWHYRYDPVRHQRRNVPLAAFDNAEEMASRIAIETDALDVRKGEGLAEAVERLGGGIKAAGHVEAMRMQRGPWRPRRKGARVRKAKGQ